ncbi:phosphotransferase enzyme family protein [Oceaniglobus trochenteri]|uniref:phosphotransferase enzyme family protein n=1 Tax=Oceaniglobus trochenteri TaxID=2763260 RepID=UPI001CFF8328|nr:phosphotransferase [Oceaniglobus trochenteri]
MHEDEALALAGAALRHWGAGTVARLIANRENAVFEVTLATGSRAALRLHRAGYQTDAAIRSELAWTEYLAQQGFPCPSPIRTAEGNLLAQPAFGPRASLVAWVDAPAIGAMGEAFAGTTEEHCRLYHALGQRVAQMHRLSARMAIPTGFERPAWDIGGLLGRAPLWGPFWNNPALSTAEADLLQQVRKTAHAELSRRNDTTGLIHADLLQENILGRADHLSIIDFDDGGFGIHLYDLGTALVQHVDCAHFSDLAAALCDGYGRGHDDMALFTLLRALASTGWVIPRLPPDDPRQRTYAERALSLATAFLG